MFSLKWSLEFSLELVDWLVTMSHPRVLEIAFAPADSYFVNTQTEVSTFQYLELVLVLCSISYDEKKRKEKQHFIPVGSAS